jgi:hypothetical protein
MTEPAGIAVTGTLAGYSSTVDGGLTVKIHLDEWEAVKFPQGFPRINIAVALVRMAEADGTEQQESD